MIPQALALHGFDRGLTNCSKSLVLQDDVFNMKVFINYFCIDTIMRMINPLINRLVSRISSRRKWVKTSFVIIKSNRVPCASFYISSLVVPKSGEVFRRQFGEDD